MYALSAQGQLLSSVGLFRRGCQNLAPRLSVISTARPVPIRRALTPRADLRGNVEGLARASNKIADSVASFLPGNIPRGAAKAGILTVGGLVAFSLLQKIFSTFLFLGVIGGAALLWTKLNSGRDSSGGSGSSDGDDPLSNARRIMDKYK